MNPGATGVLGTTVTVTSGNQTVKDSSALPKVTNANVPNTLTHRSRGILPRTGGGDLPGLLGLGLLGSFLANAGDPTSTGVTRRRPDSVVKNAV